MNEQTRQRLFGASHAFDSMVEGTRSRDGVMAPFKPGVGMFLAASTVPAIPCHLAGTFEALPAQRRIPRPGRIRLRVGSAISFESVPNDRDGWAHVARALEDAVRGLASG